MPLPCSGRQFNALGQRLAAGEPSDADIELFAQVLGVYQAVLDQVERQLGELGFQATTRVKTTGTLVDKLRRDSTLKLRSIHDLAGARIVIDGRLRDQDAARDRIIGAFAGCPRPPVVKDRRTTPSHGYRAVHVIIFPEDIPVEIQIRTPSQDRWAQAAESLGDAWGRGLRYGDGPDEPDKLGGPPFASSLTRAQVVELWIRISESIASYEQISDDLGEFQRLANSGVPGDAGVLEDIDRRFDEHRRATEALVSELGFGQLWSQAMNEDQS